MKKILFFIVALFLIGSVAFVASSTELFKGQFSGGVSTQDESGSTNSDGSNKGLAGSDLGSNTKSGGFTPGGFTPGSGQDEDPEDAPDEDTEKKGTDKYDDPTGMDDVEVSSGNNMDAKDVGSAAGTASAWEEEEEEETTEVEEEASEFYVYLAVFDENEERLSDLNEDDFDLSGNTATDFKKAIGYYGFVFDNENDVRFRLQLDGYEEERTQAYTPISSVSIQPIYLTAEEVTEFESVCESLSLSPSSYELEAEETSVPDIELTASITGSLQEVAWNRWMMAFSFTEWTSAVYFESDGSGTFNYSGSYTAEEIDNGISIGVLNSDSTSLEVTYSGGSVGDTITVSTASGCEESLTITQEEAEQEPEETEETNDDGEIVIDDDEEEEEIEEEEEDTTVEEIDYDAITDESCEHGFEDIVGEKLEDVICRLAESGVINGRSRTRFEYDDYLTRAEFLKVLLLLAGENKSREDAESTYGNHRWAEGWIARAEELDVVRVRDGFTRDFDLPISKGDAALYAVRLAGVTYYPSSSPFTDVDVSDYFGYAVIYLGKQLVDVPEDGLRYALEANDDGEFEPEAPVMRGEAMNMLIAFYLALFE